MNAPITVPPPTGEAMPMQPAIAGRRWMVSAGHWLATEAGAAMLEAGGNAVDAAVAAGITLAVVHPDQVQFGGVAPILIHRRDTGEAFSIAGLGPWPAATRPELFLDDHGGTIPLGIHRTVVPAAPDAWITALERFGTMPFHEVVQPALRCAREGFTVHALMAQYIRQFADQYRLWPQNAAVFLPGGAPPREGDLFVQSDLAAVLDHMAAESRRGGNAAARDAFYRGDIAAAMVRFHRENGGWLAAEDLASYRSEVETPVEVAVAGTRVLSCGAWCQGPSLLQMLRIATGWDLGGMGHNSAAYVHHLAEAVKFAFADRHRYFGDPRFEDVPLARLLSEEHAARARAAIRADRAWTAMPLEETAYPVPALDGDTSYVCVVDADGLTVSATPSDTSYESPLVPGLGFVPSSRGSQSWAHPTHPSRVGPGRRPRLTPNPSIAVRDGAFVMPFGGPGGDLQPQAMMQVFLNHVVFGMDIQRAVEAPRFVSHSFPHSFEPHADEPGRLDIEAPIAEAAGEALAALGHTLVVRPAVSVNVAGVCAIRADRQSGTLWGGADPRRAARVMGR